MEHLTGTHLAYFLTCKRKLWLFHNQIQMEHTSELVAEGKLIGETTYLNRPDKYRELAIGPIKIDHYDAKNRIIHEVKKTNKMEHAHIAQVWYYIWILDQHGISGVKGLLEYPKLKERNEIELNEENRKQLEQWIQEAIAICESSTCPDLTKKTICKSCSYFDFCYSGELAL